MLRCNIKSLVVRFMTLPEIGICWLGNECIFIIIQGIFKLESFLHPKMASGIHPYSSKNGSCRYANVCVALEFVDGCHLHSDCMRFGLGQDLIIPGQGLGFSFKYINPAGQNRNPCQKTQKAANCSLS